jgi:poly(3-hydroxybutyrate) depolymerase
MTTPKFMRNEVITSNDIYTLHYFPAKKVTRPTPVFVVPPHAGRHGCIAQRMIDTCVANGAHTYTVELHPATYKTKDLSVNGLVRMLFDSQTIINERHGTTKVDLIGLCQGAWLSAVYTAKCQKRVNRLCNFAGPINTKTGQENVIEKYCATMNMDYHRMIVAMNGGIQPGLMQWLSFSMVNPTQVYFERWANLGWAMLRNDEKEIIKQNRNNAWYDHPIDLAGRWFLNCLEHHFGNNELYEGEWLVGDDVVNLSNITCDIFLYAGEADEITHTQQVFDMAKKVNSRQVHTTLFPGAGHTKVFVGSEELARFAAEFF